MLRDVFYFGNKPNVHPREKPAKNLEDARSQCTTEHFWIVNEFCDYSNIDWDFDFDFLPDEESWHVEHNNIWPSVHQKDSGTWLCPKDYSGYLIYRTDVSPLKRFPIESNWIVLEKIDKLKFDFTWHPDPTDPPYIYKWGCKFYPVEVKHVLEYHVPGATQEKYIYDIVELEPDYDRITEVQKIDRTKFDISWRPDPREPPYVYVWGNKHIPGNIKSTLEYAVPGAESFKYMEQLLDVVPEWDLWVEHIPVDKSKFDFTWRPDPREPAYIYVFGNQHNPPELEHTLEYHSPGATRYKYVHDIIAPVKPERNKFELLHPIIEDSFDFSWRPDPTDPPYVYVFGNTQYEAETMPTVTYTVENAIDKKYVHSQRAKLAPSYENWIELIPIDKDSFDFSWRPDPTDPPYIYVFGNTQYEAETMPTVTYTVENATDKKYVHSQRAKLKPSYKNWIIDEPIDENRFDFSWVPNPFSPPYIYEFATQWQPNGGPKYIVEGATEIKYVDSQKAIRLPDRKNWIIPGTVEPDSFDYSWHPDNTAPPYIYEFGTQWQKTGGPTYIVPGATEKSHISVIKAKRLPNKKNYVDLLDIEEFDYGWHPDDTEPPYIYVFGNQWNNATTEPTIEYRMPGATKRKYITDIIAKVRPTKDQWKTLIPVESFDYSWRPDPYSPSYIYVFGNQWNDATTEPTIEYRMPGATKRKYITDIIAKVQPTTEQWKTLISIESFDYSWRPDPYSPSYIYVFGNQWNDATTEPTIEYHVPSATERKYITDIIAKVQPTTEQWKTLIPIESFDYSWRPNPYSPPYIYVFGNQWNDAATEPTVEYHVPSATERKYMDFPVAIPKADLTYWTVNNKEDFSTFDFSWRPNPFSPPQIYQWEDNGPRYTVPGATEVVLMQYTGKTKKKAISVYKIVTTLENLIKEHPDEVFWAINPDLNYEKFDFSWRPNEENFRHINVFGNEYSKDTQTYYINGPMYMLGYREYNYIETQTIKVDSNLSMIYIDRGNIESNQRYEILKKKYPQLIKTRYLNSWVETITRCLNKTETNLFWILNSELDYTDFQFDFYPSPWQMKMLHVFGTQWNHWGTTFLINSETFANESKYVKVFEHLGNLNFVKRKFATATNCLYDIYLIDHGNKETEEIFAILKTKCGNKKVHIVKYDKSYLNTFKTILPLIEPAKESFIWVCNSVCDYKDFDFSFICDPYAKENLHVFPSDHQKMGDTFLVDVNKLRMLVDKLKNLLDYEKINYSYNQKVSRLEPPTIIVDEDTHINSKSIDFDFPYAIFKTKDNEQLRINYNIPLCLWDEETKNIELLSTGASIIVIPKEVKNSTGKELYDYPYISKSEILQKSKPLDIVFLSNGELSADKHYEYLKLVTKDLPNRLVRVDGVNGRVAAYHAAAEASDTPWFFTVFAKLEINKDFNFNWQPDRLQIPKHYIFNALNPVNKLVYGHQAMIAYNKKLTLANTGKGLDFTLDDAHEVVDMLSGTANFNTDPYSTWRTAFREVIKLKSDYKDISYERLQTWLTVAEGEYAQDCLQGAQDGVEYYQSVNGDPDQLKLTYEWDWLKQYYNRKYK